MLYVLPWHMEMFDVLTEDGELTGEVVTREQAHKCGAWHRAVLIFLVNSKNQILMQKRSAAKKLWPGCWDGTGGGHVNSGEIGLFGVIRELREELGIEVKPSDVRYIGGYRSCQHNEKMHNRHFNEFFVAHKDVDIKDIRLQDEEVEEVKWISFEKFKEWTKSRSSDLTEKWQAFDALVRYLALAVDEDKHNESRGEKD